MNTINKRSKKRSNGSKTQTAPAPDSHSYAERFASLRQSINKDHAEELLTGLLHAENQSIFDAQPATGNPLATKSLPELAKKYLELLQNAPLPSGKFSFYDLAGEMHRLELLHEETVGDIRWVLKRVSRGVYTEEDGYLLNPVIWALTYAVLGPEAAARLEEGQNSNRKGGK